MNALLLRIAERALALVIEQQREELAGRLAALQGKALALELSAPALRLSLSVRDGGVQLVEGTAPDASVTIRGTPSDFLAWFLRRDGAEALPAGRLSISGEVGTAQAWQRLLGGLSLDWEEWLARLLGDLPAHQLARAARGFGLWLRGAGRTLQLDVSEYLRYEAGLLPTRERLEAHFHELRVLAMDVDRASARLDRLLQRAARAK